MCVIDNYSILRTHVLAQSSRLILNLSFPRKLPSRYPSPRVSVVTLLFAHRPVFLLSYTECQTCVSAELSELVYLVLATELTGTKGKSYPFYVHRPVLFSVLHCIANGTKGKRSPFLRTQRNFHVHWHRYSHWHKQTGRYQQRDVEQRYRG